MVSLNNKKIKIFINIAVVVALVSLVMYRNQQNPGIQYFITASELGTDSLESTEIIMSHYRANPEVIRESLDKQGLKPDDFVRKVRMSLNGRKNKESKAFEGIIITFESSLPKEQLTPTYQLIITDIKRYTKEQSTRLDKSQQ